MFLTCCTVVAAASLLPHPWNLLVHNAGMVIATLVVLKRLGAFPTGSQAASAVPPHVRHQQMLEQQQQALLQQQPQPMNGVEYQHPQQQQELSIGVLPNGQSGSQPAAAAAAVPVTIPSWYTSAMKSKRISSSSGLTPTAAGATDLWGLVYLRVCCPLRGVVAEWLCIVCFVLA